MSWKALNWAAEQTTGSPVCKLVLLLLADRADEAHSCYPRVAYLARVSELGESTVRRAIGDLASAGLLRVLARYDDKGARRSNRYVLSVDGEDTPLPDVPDWSQVQPYRRDTPEDPNPDAPAPAPDPAAGLPPGGTGCVHLGGGVFAQVDGPPLPQRDTPPSRSGTTPLPQSEDPPPADGGPPSHSGRAFKEQDPSRDPSRDPSPPPQAGAPAATPGAAAPEEEATRAQSNHPAAALIDTATARVPAGRRPGPAQRARLIALAAAALRAGWTPQALTDRLTDGTYTGAQTVAGAMTYRLTPGRGLPHTPPAPPAPPAPSATYLTRQRRPWCGDPCCDPVTRQRLDDAGRPRAHPDGRGLVFCDDCTPTVATAGQP